MDDREAFLKALKEDEDDETTRLVFADWLEERGEVEEAERQRKWKAAKSWLVEFCEKYGESDSSEEERICFRHFAQICRDSCDGDFEIDCGPFERLSMAIDSNFLEFWENWTIYSGIKLKWKYVSMIHSVCSC